MTEEQIRKQERDRILEIIKKEKQFGYNCNIFSRIFRMVVFVSFIYSPSLNNKKRNNI